MFDFIRKNMCTRYSTLKGSYCECKGRCLIRMLQLACGILPVDSRIKIIKCLTCEMSKCISTAQACTKCGPRCSPRSWRAELRRLAQSVDRDRGPRHFSCQFLRKVTLVKCPSAFQLRRLAQSPVWSSLLVCGILPVNSRISACCAMSRRIQMHFDCAGSHKMWSAVLVCGILPANSRIEVLLVQCPSAFRLRSLAQSVGRDRGPRHFSW